MNFLQGGPGLITIPFLILDFKKVFVLVGLTLGCSGHLLGQEDMVRGHTCGWCALKEHNAPPPYHFSWKREAPYLATGIGLVTASVILANTNQADPYSAEELQYLDRNDVNEFDRPATYNWDPEAADRSDLVRTGVVLLPIMFLANHHTRQDFGALLVMSAEVFLINYGLTNAVKNITNRYRPFVYNEEAPTEERTGDGSMLSYYSGHTSHTAAFSFFFAKVLNDYHPDMNIGAKTVLWGFAAVVPAAAGALRYQAGKHYPTDIMTGYVLGAATGILVPHFHKKPIIKNTGLIISPVYLAGGGGLNLRMKF